MRTQWQMVSPAADPTGDFDPVLWSAVHGTAADVFEAVCEPVIRAVLDALGAHRDLLGYPDLDPGDHELCGFAFALAAITLQRADGTRERYELMLQSVAAQLYRRYARQTVAGAPGFWTFLQSRLDVLYRDPRVARRGYDIGFLVQRFLSVYGMGGPDDQDLAVSIHRLIAPHLYRGLEAARGGLAGRDERMN